MSKITFENKKGKITIINRLSYPETVNERVYKAIASGMFEGFLPVSICQKRKETRIECVAQGLIPCTQYFNCIVTKKMFLGFVHEMALIIKNCEKNMVNANNLELQMDKMFIEPQTQKVKCIFWPVVNNQRANPPYLFLKQLPLELKFYPNEDNNYLETYKAFFDGITPFSVNSFDKMVLKLSGKESTGGYTTPSEAVSRVSDIDSKDKNKEIDSKNKNNIEYNPFSVNSEQMFKGKDESIIKNETNGLFCPYCNAKIIAGANFCGKCGAKQSTREKVEAIHPNKNSKFDFGTNELDKCYGVNPVSDYKETEKTIFPSLIRLKTKEVFSVNKTPFRIGTEQSNCDLIICDNNYISRNHADIIEQNGIYYILDRNSTNKTFVDGKVIPAEKEIEIFHGIQIRLANEDFIFKIESQMS